MVANSSRRRWKGKNRKSIKNLFLLLLCSVIFMSFFFFISRGVLQLHKFKNPCNVFFLSLLQFTRLSNFYKIKSTSRAENDFETDFEKVATRLSANIWPSIIWSFHGNQWEKFPQENYSGEDTLSLSLEEKRKSTILICI